ARVEPRQLEQLLFPRISPAAKAEPIARGVPASPGAATGAAVFDADTAEEWGKQGKSVILVRIETNPNDVHGMVQAKGILTQTGGTASHAALVARGMGRPCIVGASKVSVDEARRSLSVDGRTVKEGEEITIDGTTGDIRGIFQTMAGLPVVIRLIDPPLHEFLPNREELISETSALKATGKKPARLKRLEKLLARVEDLHEANPMLGLRGGRLLMLYPEIARMQVRAIMEAACDLRKRGVDARPEIMIPLVGTLAELREIHEQLRPVVDAVQKEKGVTVAYRFGTMIELPRAALTAGEIAADAEFFSFGTNDLTQTTFGYSRDDAERHFIVRYLERRILERNPFETIDVNGVGRLMAMAVSEGRKTRPNMEIG